MGFIGDWRNLPSLVAASTAVRHGEASCGVLNLVEARFALLRRVEICSSWVGRIGVRGASLRWVDLCAGMFGLAELCRGVFNFAKACRGLLKFVEACWDLLRRGKVH